MLLACKEGWELLKRQWGWLKQNERVIPVLLGICISLNVVQPGFLMWPIRIMAYFAFDTYKLPMNFCC